MGFHFSLGPLWDIRCHSWDTCLAFIGLLPVLRTIQTGTLSGFSLLDWKKSLSPFVAYSALTSGRERIGDVRGGWGWTPQRGALKNMGWSDRQEVEAPATLTIDGH